MAALTMRSPIYHSLWIGFVLLAVIMSACQNGGGSGVPVSPAGVTSPPAPTPSADVLQANAIVPDEPALRLTIPSITLLERAPGESIQLLAVLADPQGGYSYVLYPANREGVLEDRIDLSRYPLELSLDAQAEQAHLWVLVWHNLRYQPAEQFGVEALATSLALSFQDWLVNEASPADALAAIVAASGGALYEWFASIDVLGQLVLSFTADGGWQQSLMSASSPDGGFTLVYSLDYSAGIATPGATPAATSEDTSPADDTATPEPPSTVAYLPGYSLSLDETFEDGQTSRAWFEDAGETYRNAIVNGTYQIALTDIGEREFVQSWGSVEGASFADYVVEAHVRMVQTDVVDGRYGLWFNYQDDFNFLYFGISSTGEYRAALIARNQTVLEIRDWAEHPAILPAPQTNVLTIEAETDGTFTLSANGEVLLTYQDPTFTTGSVAFFCYAKSTPATCELDSIQVWEQVG